MKGPPVSLRTRKVDSISGLQINTESEPETSYHATWGRPKASPALVHARHVSTQSMASSRFVDILDAQSEIKPSSFRSRIRAAGARDYGEDVADRNIGVNGVDLTSAPVQAFYATSSGDASAQSNQSTPTPPVARTNTRKEEVVFKSSRPFESVDNSRRTRSLNSASFNPYPKTALSFQPREPGAPPPRKLESPVSSKALNNHGHHRQSASSSVPLGTVRPATGSKPRPASLHPSALGGTDITFTGRQEHGRASSDQHPNIRHDPTGNELGIFTPPLPKTASMQPPLSPPLPRDAFLLAKRNGLTPLSPPPLVNSRQHPASQRPSSAARPKSRSGPATSPMVSSPNVRDFSKRHSMTSAVGGGESSRHRPRSSRGDWPRSTTVEPGFSSRGFLGRVDIDNSTADAALTSPAPSPR